MALKPTLDTSGVHPGSLHDDLKVEECGHRRLAGSVGDHEGGEAERMGGSEGGQGGEEDCKEDGNDGEEVSENSDTSAVVGPERFPSFYCI
jgi:hypothetical protein